MKKSLKKSSYRKAVINGLLIFGGVALLTTGFATWVIGANNSTDDIGDTNVTVDTAKRNNINLTVDLDGDDNTIHLGENTTSGSGNFIKVEEGEASEQPEIDGYFGPTDFKVKMNISLTVGEDVEEKPNKIKFDFNYESETEKDATEANQVTISADNSIHKTTDKSLTYVDISATSTLDINTFDTSTENGSRVYKKNGLEVTLFEWGSFFDKKAPSQFYNDLYDGVYTGEGITEENIYHQRKLTNSVADVNAVYNELDALKKSFNSKTIAVTASAVYEAA